MIQHSLLAAEAVPLTRRDLAQEFQDSVIWTLAEKGKVLVSISIPSISSVFYPYIVSGSLFVDQKSDLVPASFLRVIINSLENHGCFSPLS